MAKKQDKKRQPPPPSPPSSKAKKQDEKRQPPSSPSGTLPSTKSLAKSATMGTKQEKQLPSHLPDFSSSSSSEGDDSPPPAGSRLEKPAGFTAAPVLPKHPEPSDSSDDEVEEDDEDLETDKESNEEESSDGSAPVAAKTNPPPLLHVSLDGEGKRTSSSTSISGSGSEGEGDSEEEDSSSESDQPPQPPPNKQAGSVAMKTVAPVAENDSESSSDSDRANSSPRKSSQSAAASLSSKQVDGPSQPTDKSGIIATLPSSTPLSNKKRKKANDITEEAGPEKKISFRRIWTNEDELELLRGILEYKERYQVLPSSIAQMEPLYASMKGLLSIPVTLTQMHDKVRRIRLKYSNKSKRINNSTTSSTLNAHDAAFIDLSKKIWGASKVRPSIPEKTIKGEKTKDIKNVKVKGKQFPMGYPSLHRFIKNELTNIPLVLHSSHIRNAKSNELERKCEKLAISEVRLHVKKQELFSAALELIEGALPK